MALPQPIRTTTNTVQQRSFSQPDETRTFPLGRFEVVTVGGVTFGRGTFEPGWRWSECIAPLAKTRTCQASHLHYQLSGRMHVLMDDGTEIEFGAGDVAMVPPGHDAWVVGNEPVVIVDITGMEQFAKQK